MTSFAPFYPGGYKNLPDNTTPPTADALNHIESWLATIWGQVGAASPGWTVVSGLSTSNAATTSAALTAAIASFAGGPGLILVPPSPAGTPWLFQGLIDFHNTDLVGCGGSFAQSPTIFQATSTDAQFRFSGGGSLSGGWKLSGGGVAYTPFSRRTSTGGSAGRHFRDFLVQANADNPATPRFLDAHGATAITLRVVNAGGTQTTASITSFGSETAAALQTTLQGLSNVGAGKCTVTSDEATGGPFLITFDVSLGVCTLTVNASTGGTGPTINGTNPLCEFITSQNDHYDMMVANNAVNDLLYFDGGIGGLVFTNPEWSTYGRYGIYMDNLITSTTVYTCPADIDINGGRIEGSAGRSCLKAGSNATSGGLGAYNIKFDGFDFFTSNVCSGPLLDIFWGYQITVRSSGLQSTGATSQQAGTVGIRLKNTSFLTLMDRISFTNLATCIELDDNACFVDDKSTSYFVRATNRILATGTATAAQASANFSNGVATNMLGSAQTAIAHYTATKNALFYIQLANGQHKYYPGTGFVPDTITGRVAPASWGVSNAGQVLVTGYGARGSEFGTGSAGLAGSLYVDTTAPATLEVSDGTNWNGVARYGNYHPADLGLLACTFDPMTASQTPLQLTASAINWVKCKIPAGSIITNLTIQIGTGGAGASVTQGFLGVYDTSGNLLGTTANQTTSWQSVGRKTHALVSPIAASIHDRDVILVMYAVATTLPKFLYNGGSGVPDFGGQSAASWVAGQITGQVGLSALPSTITLSSSGVWFKFLIGVT